MKRLAVSLTTFAAGAAFFVTIEASTASAASTCTMTTIAKIAMPTRPARYEAGRMTLANGATLELSGALKSPAMYRVSELHVGDGVAACYVPRRPTPTPDHRGRLRSWTRATAPITER